MARGGKPETVSDEAWRLPSGDVEAILAGRHGDPFAVLGLHATGSGLVARCFIPGAEAVQALTLAGKPAGMLSPRSGGFFEGKLRIRKRQPLRYSASNTGGHWIVADPYSFGPVLGPFDDYFLGEGRHLRLFDKLGAHPIRHEGADGVHFAVWAPNASRVSVVGDFNGWDGRRNVMRFRTDSGVWETFVPDIGPGTVYKYELSSMRPVRPSR